MSDLGRALIALGALIALVGIGIILWDRFGLPRVPGDIVAHRGKFTFYFPVVTCVIISIVLTVLLNLFFRRR